MKCSICQGKIDKMMNGWDQGHNAQPVNDGRCCSICNETVVIPARFRMMGLSEPNPPTSEPNPPKERS